MCSLTAYSESDALACTEARPVLFMATITAPPLAIQHSRSSTGGGARACSVGSVCARRAGSSAAARVTDVGSTSTLPQSLDVCSLEGCGLGWRVRPPLQRRSPWTVIAQRMRLCIEAVGGCKVEKLYTLLDHHELAPRISFEVCIGDLHAGDTCHVVVLVWMPSVADAQPFMEAVRFSLSYVDAVKIDTKSCEISTGIARTPVDLAATGSRPLFEPLIMDRERNRVLVDEALQNAVSAANARRLDAACALLYKTELKLKSSLSTIHGDALSLCLLEVVTAALRKLELVLSASNSRSNAPLLEKLPNSLPQVGPIRMEVPPSTVMTAIMGSSANEPGRAPLKPRTFSVSLPPSSLSPSPISRDDPNYVVNGASTSNSPGPGNSPCNSSLLGAASSPHSGSDSPPAAHAHWPRRPLQLRDKSADSVTSPMPNASAASTSTPAEVQEPSAAAPNALSSGAEQLQTLRCAGTLVAKPPPPALRVFGAVSFAAGKRNRVGGALKGRPRLQPPVLMPLHAPPMAARDGNAGAATPPPLGIVPPLPPPSTSRQPQQGSYDSWLCRLLRMKEPPLPLPDELIMHIFSFLQPGVLFHHSLSPPTLIVDKATTVRGHHTTISSALRAVQPGDRILIRPGIYRESLRIEVPVMLLGCPGSNSSTPGSGVTITSSRNHTLHSTAPFALLENVTLRQTGSSGRSCLLVSRGSLEVSDCDISSASGLCVEVMDAASPIVRHSRIHDGLAAGLWFRAGAKGVVEGNEIWGNGWSGVQISDESDPLLLRNYIHDNKSAGLISFNHGRGVARHNDITCNGKGGVQVRSRASPELACNRIFNERSFGVWVYEHGLGRFEDNDIYNNAWSGFQVEEGSAPIVIGNRLRGNRSAGIVVYNRGSGTYEWNDISANGRCGVQIKSGSAPFFRHNRIHNEKQAGVLTAEDGTGVLEENDIFDNQWSGVQTEGPSNPLLRRNRIHHNGGAGFIAYQNGSGLLEGNNIYGNKKYGVQSKTGGHPTVRANHIHDKVYGIYLTESGSGIYEENKIHNIRGSGIYVAADCSPVLSNNHGIP